MDLSVFLNTDPYPTASLPVYLVATVSPRAARRRTNGSISFVVRVMLPLVVQCQLCVQIPFSVAIADELVGNRFDVLFVRQVEQYVQFELSTCRLWLAYEIVVEVLLITILFLFCLSCNACHSLRNERIFALLALFLVLGVSCSVFSISVITGGA